MNYQWPEDSTPEGIRALFRRIPCAVCGEMLLAADADDYSVNEIQDLVRFPFDPETGKDTGWWHHRPLGEPRWVHGDGRHGDLAQHRIYDGLNGRVADRVGI